MSENRETGFPDQERLVQTWLALLQKAEPATTLIETHISWILASGRYAYKIKKALHLDFVDYSDLAMRHFYCREEIRLNRRTAPEIYLDVVQIGGDFSEPRLNASPALEYAVKMRRFDDEKQLDRLLEEDALTRVHIASLAKAVGDFHQGLMNVLQEETVSPYDAADFQLRTVAENLQELRDLLTDPDDLALWEEVKKAHISEFTLCRDRFEERRQAGFVCECHGDLHMGNLVFADGRVVLFDGVEFDPQYRWMDVMSDVAFAFMDLLYFHQEPFAWRFLNDYLEQTGDYDGLALLRFYAAYHATVRAKVQRIRLLQEMDGIRETFPVSAEYRRYMELAKELLTERQPALIITMGLAGSGKTVFTRMAVEKLSGIGLHSDVERMRLYGGERPRSGESVDEGRYTESSREKVYERLRDKADTLLRAGMTVIVDASFLKASHRALFRNLAESRSVPFAIVSLAAGMETLQKRLKARRQRAEDASDAGPEVLPLQNERMEPLETGEKRFSMEFANEGDSGFDENAALWERLKNIVEREKA